MRYDFRESEQQYRDRPSEGNILPEGLRRDRRGAVVSTEQGLVFAVGISSIVIIAVAMAIRVYVRLGIIKSVGSDDVLMVLGTVREPALLSTVISIDRSSVGNVRPLRRISGSRILRQDQIAIDDMTPMLQATYSTRLLYVVATMLVKMSLLIFYSRLDQPTLYILMFMVVGFSIASFGILTFSCYPPAMFWDVSGSIQGKCTDPNTQQAFYDVHGALNIVIDLVIYTVPIPMLWKIQIPTRQKIALTFILGLGLVAVAAGCVYFSYVRLLAQTDETFFYLADSLNWCSIEIYLAIFCGSTSAYKVLLRTHLPGLLGSSRGKNSYDANHQKSGSNNRPYQGLGGGRSGKSTIVGGSGSHTEHRDNDSEELIIQSGAGNGNSIIMKTEFRMEVLDSRNRSGDSGGGVPGASASGSHQRGVM
ncbi:hypothetical protein DL768_007280 [Monosporascus sp. mg162]|nr:hypothetical protein DL768_007280 [Monosporascus sp. mg162]